MIAALMFAILTPQFAIACTTFMLADDESVVMGKSYDWLAGHEHGRVMTNARGVRKTAILQRSDRPLEWVSRYSSITFNQFGKEFPLGGMNEQGLAIEILVLHATAHIVESDPRPAVNEAQFIQYNLDRFGSTREVVQALPQIRIEKAFIGAHYLVCDATADCAVIEYLDGKLAVSDGDRLPVAAVTNNPYQELWATYRSGLYVPPPTSLGRFQVAARTIEAFYRDPAALDASAWDVTWKILHEVEHDVAIKKSQWRISYILTTRTIVFQNRSNSKYRYIDATGLFHGCDQPSRVFDMNVRENRPDPDWITERFVPWTEADNRALIEKNNLILSQHLRDLAASYPSQHTRCAD